VNRNPTHYEVLGVAADATQDAIRKRFRALARQFHPDLNRDRPEAHEQFLKIKEAYEVISDPNQRASYDLALRDIARRQAEFRSRSFGSAPTQTPRPGAPNRPPNWSAARPPAGPAAQPSSDVVRARREAEARRQKVARTANQARQAYATGNLRESQRLCQEVLETARHGPTYELLGDIYSRQGRLDEALQYYTLAAQLQSYNGQVMAKLNHVVARQQGAPTRTQAQRVAIESAIPPARILGHKLSVTCFGLAVVIAILSVPYLRLATENALIGWPAPLPQTWTLTHLALMAAAGLVTGAALAMAAWIRPIDQELTLPAATGRRATLPIGVPLALLSVVCLHAAFVAYVALGAARSALSSSVLVLFGVNYALVLGFIAVNAFAGAPQQFHIETAVAGGNVIFLSSLCGWFFGDLFRPYWAM
jgi:curved DNA-binding protein CbpA